MNFVVFQVAVFIAPVVACFLSVFGFCIRYYDTPPAFKWIFNLSYYRAAFQSLVYTLYGLNRTELYCADEEIYCHYQDPVKFLGEMDIVDVNLVSNISLIVCTWCLLHAATYLTLWIKLNKRWMRLQQVFVLNTLETKDIFHYIKKFRYKKFLWNVTLVYKFADIVFKSN